VTGPWFSGIVLARDIDGDQTVVSTASRLLRQTRADCSEGFSILAIHQVSPTGNPGAFPRVVRFEPGLLLLNEKSRTSTLKAGRDSLSKKDQDSHKLNGCPKPIQRLTIEGHVAFGGNDFSVMNHGQLLCLAAIIFPIQE
jgi:hypothetical protein